MIDRSLHTTDTYAASSVIPSKQPKAASSSRDVTEVAEHQGERGSSMQLDKAFEFAVILAWRDLLKVVTPASVRVEYRHESKIVLDHVTLWADKGKGYCDRVCDYWTWASAAHANGIRFWRGHDSDPLARLLGFIMKNQDHFVCPTTAREGLVLVYPPGDEQRAEAAAWEAALPGTTPAGEMEYSLTSSN
jgi:hypothetical protein